MGWIAVGIVRFTGLDVKTAGVTGAEGAAVLDFFSLD
jgi:hypothetical protein